MYFSDVMRGLLRRWYVLLIGFVLTGVGAYGVFEAVPVRYEAGASMLLLPPDESVELQQGSNPYLLLGGLEQALAVLTTRLSSQAVREDLPSATGDYAVGADTTSGAAFLLITTEADTEQNALDLLDAVQSAAGRELITMQQELDVTGESSIMLMPVTADVAATPLSSTRMQLTLAVTGVGIVLTLVAAAVVEGLSATRSRRRAAQEAPAQRQRKLREPLRARELPQEFGTPPLVGGIKRKRPSEAPNEAVPADEPV